MQWPSVAIGSKPGAISLSQSYWVTLRPSASKIRQLFLNRSAMRPGEARLCSPSSIQNFHSAAGTKTSAFGKALVVSIEQPVHMVAMEMRDDDKINRIEIDAGGREIVGKLAEFALGLVVGAGTTASINENEL